MYLINSLIYPLVTQKDHFFPLGYHFGSDASSVTT